MLKRPFFYKIMVIKDSLGFFPSQLIRNQLAMPGEVYPPIESGKHSGGPHGWGLGAEGIHGAGSLDEEAGKAGWEEAGGQALKSWTDLSLSLQDYRNAFEKGVT